MYHNKIYFYIYVALKQYLSQIFLESIHYGRYSNVLSGDNFKSVCITIVISNKDSDWRIFIDPPIYQMHVDNVETNIRGRK